MAAAVGERLVALTEFHDRVSASGFGLGQPG
jgi:hypothetical protein